MKPPHGRRGIDLAGGHHAAQHAPRTVAMVHSKGRQHNRSTNAAAGSHHLQLLDFLSSKFSCFLSGACFRRTAYDAARLPCPSKHVLDEMGLTAEEAGCEPTATRIVPDDRWLLKDDCAGPPPFPPKEILVLLNLTLDELQCDSVVTPPCPYPEIATEFGLDVITSIPCVSDLLLFELELIYGVWCEPVGIEEAWFEGGIADFNYTKLECPAPVPCSLR